MVDEEEFLLEESEEINSFGDEEEKCFLTKKQHDEQLQGAEVQKDDYQLGYHNAMIAFQRQLNLRNKDVIISDPQKKVNQEKASTNVPNKEAKVIPVVPRSRKGKEVITEPVENKDVIISKPIDNKDQPKQKIPSQELPVKSVDNKRELAVVEAPVRPFSSESEVAKIKMSLPFNELCRNPKYKNRLMKMLKSGDNSGFSDTISL